MDEVRIPWVFDSRGVTKGADQIVKEFDRVEKSSKSAISGGSKSGVPPEDKYAQRAFDARRTWHAKLEREIREHQRRVTAMERNHASRGSARGLGDALNILTGGSGNVMRLNAASHFGASLGGASAGLVAGGILARTIAASRELSENTRSLQMATGSAAENPLWRSSATGGLMRSLPLGMSDQFSTGRGNAVSLAGMRSQRGEIAGGIEKVKGSQKGLMGRMAAGWSDISAPITGAPNEAEQLASVIAGHEKLFKIDQAIAGVLKQQGAIDRERENGSEHSARLKQIELDTAQKLKEIEETGLDNKAGLAERREASKNAIEAGEIEKRAAEREHDAAQDQLNTAKAIAYFRGGASDKAVQSARQELDLATRTWQNAKKVTVEKRRQLELGVAQAQAVQDAAEMAAENQRAQEKVAERQGKAALGVAQANVAGAAARFAPDEHKRFAEQQAVTRRAANVGVVNAVTALDEAKAKGEREKLKFSGNVSPETQHEIEMAGVNAGAMEANRQEVEKQLAAEVVERREARFLTPEGKRRPIGEVLTTERKRRQVFQRVDRARGRAEGRFIPAGAGALGIARGNMAQDPRGPGIHGAEGLGVDPANAAQDPRGGGLHTGDDAAASIFKTKPWEFKGPEPGFKTDFTSVFDRKKPRPHMDEAAKQLEPLLQMREELARHTVLLERLPKN